MMARFLQWNLSEARKAGSYPTYLYNLGRKLAATVPPVTP